MIRSLLILPLLAFSALTYSQTTLTLRPDGAAGKDVMISSYNPNGTYATHPEINANAWTISGTTVINRIFLSFDLSSIPAGASITTAQLYLYYNPNTTHSSGVHSSLSGSNTSLIQRVIGSWDESTLTWNNQPGSTSDNETIIPQSTTSTQNYTIDVKNIINDIVTSGTNNGMMIKLQTESYYRCLLFASSDHTDSTLRPKLVVVYSATGVDENANLFTNLVSNANKSSNSIDVSLTSNKKENVTVQLYSFDGKLIQELENVQVDQGMNNINMPLGTNIASGIYMINVRGVNGRSTSKLFWE
jgi:hypothetical protein